MASGRLCFGQGPGKIPKGFREGYQEGFWGRFPDKVTRKVTEGSGQSRIQKLLLSLLAIAPELAVVSQVLQVLLVLEY